jgi:ABC-type amino acid transport substrate-binding protein
MRCHIPLKLALLALLLATPLASTAAGKCERLIATGAADNPPFLWRDPANPNRLVGANADLLKQISDTLGLKLEVLYTGDAKKAREEVASGRVDVLLDATLSLKQLETLDYIHPSIVSLQTFPWVRSQPDFIYAGRRDLVGKKGAVVAGNRFASDFDAFAKGNLQLASTPTFSDGVKDLLAGKADYLLHERYSAVAQAAKAGVLDQLLRLQPAVSTRGMHLAVAHDSACNDAWLRGRLAVEMTRLRAAGVPQQLLQSNLERWAEQQAAPVSTSKE